MEELNSESGIDVPENLGNDTEKIKYEFDVNSYSLLKNNNYILIFFSRQKEDFGGPYQRKQRFIG